MIRRHRRMFVAAIVLLPCGPTEVHLQFVEQEPDQRPEKVELRVTQADPGGRQLGPNKCAGLCRFQPTPRRGKQPTSRTRAGAPVRSPATLRTSRNHRQALARAISRPGGRRVGAGIASLVAGGCWILGEKGYAVAQSKRCVGNCKRRSAPSPVGGPHGSPRVYRS